jgi:hypothetical protein
MSKLRIPKAKLAIPASRAKAHPKSKISRLNINHPLIVIFHHLMGEKAK